MRRQPIPVGYLGFGEESFRERADHARSVGIELLLMPRTKGNLRRIHDNEPITIQSWTGSHMEEREVPLPKVWYDRTNPWPTSSLTEHVASALTKRKVHFINDRYLRRFAADKWMQYVFLSKRGARMPATSRYTTENCIAFLHVAHTVFVKKRDGSQGNDTLIINKLPLEAGYTVRDIGVTEKNAVHMHEFDGVGALETFLRSLDLSRHIAQCGVHVDKIFEDDNVERVYDFRAIFQRGGDGTPRMTLAYIRVGAPNSQQSNIHQQGHAQDVESVFENPQQLYRQLRKYGMQVFTAIASGYQVGELGLDFVRDINGKLWLLEVNARPGSTGVNQLREWVPKPYDYVRKGWLLFDDSFTNARRKAWGKKYLAYRRNPYRYAKFLAHAE
jgi:glutathione synthase/RimK-type ligase-like ATP-grasp enzyme